MEPTRREFMRQVGVTLAGLLLSGCDLASQLSVPQTPTSTPYGPPIMCYIMVITATPIPTASSRNEPWRALRACWLALKDPRLRSQDDTVFPQKLRQQHRDALYTLVANGDLQSDVAAGIYPAFEQALMHIRRQWGTCCYEPLPLEYTPRENLMTQAAALTEMAGRSNIDPGTVDRARAALQRDMAWLSRLYFGSDPGKLESIEATPAEVEAARVLVELLLERK